MSDVLLAHPGRVITDDRGGLWIADTGHHRVIGADRSGAVHTLIGSGERGSANGSLQRATFDQPQGLALTADRATLYVADCGAGAVRRVDLGGGTVTTVATTAAADAPWGLALDEHARRLYIAMAGARQIARLGLAEHRLELITGADAGLAAPTGLCLSADRRRLYVADRDSSTVQVIHVAETPGQAMAETVAGGFRGCMDVALSPAGIVVADTGHHALRGINPRHGTVVTVWQGQTPAPLSGPDADSLSWPAGVAFDRVDRSYVVADTRNHRIVRVARDAAWARPIELHDPSR